MWNFRSHSQHYPEAKINGAAQQDTENDAKFCISIGGFHNLLSILTANITSKIKLID